MHFISSRIRMKRTAVRLFFLITGNEMKQIFSGSGGCKASPSRSGLAGMVSLMSDLSSFTQIIEVRLALFRAHFEQSIAIHIKRTVKFILSHPEAIPLKLDASVPDKSPKKMPSSG
ncbi:MAG: hypothetical protein WCW34_04460 [Patescibacteria group bacterium]|jgi:hypothetical protein